MMLFNDSAGVDGGWGGVSGGCDFAPQSRTRFCDVLDYVTVIVLKR